MEAEDLFPKAYEPAFGGLLDVLVERLGPEESEALLRSVGRRLVEGKTVLTHGTRARLEAVAGVLNELGTLAELEEEDDTLLIQGYGCLLVAVTLDHPAVSALAEALVAEVAGVPVHERCDRSEGPRCFIEVASADEVTQRSVSLLGTFRYSGGPIWRLSSYLGFDPFRGISHKEGIRVQREHQVQGTTRVHFPCYLQRPHDALGPHEQRRGTCRVPIYLDTNSYHSNPPSTSDALYVPFTPLLLHIGNSGA